MRKDMEKTAYHAYYLGERYEAELGASVNRQFLYIGGDAYSAPAVLVNQGSSWNLYYICRDHLGSMTHLVNAGGTVAYEYSYDVWGRLRDPATLATYAPDNEPALFLNRGYTGHEHLPLFGLINMNARLYDPALGLFLSPDPYIQAPDFSQNYNRYGYCWNNPLKYTDKDGEAWWVIPVIASAVFATGNTVAHAVRGDINNWGDGLKYFGQGAIVGFALGSAWQFAPLITWQGIGQSAQNVMTWYAVGQAGLGVAGTAAGAFNGGWRGVGNGAKALLGNFYMDENNWLGGLAQGFLRHTWEMPQSLVGHGYTQVRNIGGNVDRVDYLGGATFATNENSTKGPAISLGNYINVNIDHEITGDFDSYIITNPMYMHEYGHTFDSRAFGFSYLFAVGIPSIISANSSELVINWKGKPANNPNRLSTHDVFWTETRANRRAKKYYEKYYGVNWNYPDYPLYNPF